MMKRILHVCGGDPPLANIQRPCHLVFSTYVEVILKICYSYDYIFRILHVCGGDPTLLSILPKSPLYSPRMWR